MIFSIICEELGLFGAVCVILLFLLMLWIKGEFLENGVDNPLKHVRGAISMARDDAYDTADTQFFVVHKDAAKLDGRYAAFGEMLSGFSVLDKIADEPTYGPETWNKPVKMPVIRKITVE